MRSRSSASRSEPITIPRQLSGGEEQRTGDRPRSVVTDPKADHRRRADGEPGRRAPAANVLDLLATLNGRFHKTILMVTHDASAAARAKRVVRLNKGALVHDAGVKPRRDS